MKNRNLTRLLVVCLAVLAVACGSAVAKKIEDPKLEDAVITYLRSEMGHNISKALAETEGKGLEAQAAAALEKSGEIKVESMWLTMPVAKVGTRKCVVKVEYTLPGSAPEIGYYKVKRNTDSWYVESKARKLDFSAR